VGVVSHAENAAPVASARWAQATSRARARAAATLASSRSPSASSSRQQVLSEATGPNSAAWSTSTAMSMIVCAPSAIATASLPGIQESAGKKKGHGTTGHGNPYPAKVLGEAAVAASRTDTFLGELYRRIARRRGKIKAIVAVGLSILVIIWHLLLTPRPASAG